MRRRTIRPLLQRNSDFSSFLTLNSYSSIIKRIHTFTILKKNKDKDIGRVLGKIPLGLQRFAEAHGKRSIYVNKTNLARPPLGKGNEV